MAVVAFGEGQDALGSGVAGGRGHVGEGGVEKAGEVVERICVDVGVEENHGWKEGCRGWVGWWDGGRASRSGPTRTGLCHGIPKPHGQGKYRRFKRRRQQRFSGEGGGREGSEKRGKKGRGSHGDRPVKL